ncbi:MAG: hypothetical protein A2792_00920 [Sphingomonadales bacterium RIFCSPHIGHO2_01_FULL_65_20]|uniref:DUF5694 domain-containing protein n=1 Tax=unclassified Blastomonas TaxID=2626550 RepID=UPI0008327117|nr:DUF5694 domain-containing protein [Blastomonas sp.]OHC93747.1 MAG: hypothetical protein A2792_00920 [Sphingomonadales bacterium RIFCSPHIGHO2_01_FULL_65_20]
MPIVAALGLAAAPLAAQEYRPNFRPDALKGPPKGAPNEVLVLGTPHLAGLPDRDTTAALNALLTPLLDRLAAWHPTAIATENLSGLQCDSLRRYPQRYAETVKTYCFDPAAAAAATGLDLPAANAEAERLLADWPAAPTPGQRRHLAAVFLAAGEPGSAIVQWLRLPPEERRAGDGLTEPLVQWLEGRLMRKDETCQIAAALAARLGLERLWSVDDHSADTPSPSDPAENKAFEQAITTAWDNPASKARQDMSAALEARLDQPDGLLNLYRTYNAPDGPMLVYRSDFGAALAEPSPQGFGRQYLAYWETRNLRMVANMRDVLGRYPGTRMLTVVGLSHKGYYEAYLDQMHDVRLVDPLSVLR